MALPTPPGGPAASAPADAPIDAGIGAAPPIDGTDAGDDDASVLLTVLKGPDGSYVLVKGDEDDGADDEGMSEDDVTAGAGDDAGQGQHFTSVGALLKGILDMLNEDQGDAGGGGSPDDQFAAGFSGGAGGPPGKMAG